jgi:hypothetical protein
MVEDSVGHCFAQTFAEAKALTSAPAKALHSSKFVPGSSRSKNQEGEIQQDAVVPASLDECRVAWDARPLSA